MSKQMHASENHARLSSLVDTYVHMCVSTNSQNQQQHQGLHAQCYSHALDTYVHMYVSTNDLHHTRNRTCTGFTGMHLRPQSPSSALLNYCFCPSSSVACQHPLLAPGKANVNSRYVRKSVSANFKIVNSKLKVSN